MSNDGRKCDSLEAQLAELRSMAKLTAAEGPAVDSTLQRVEPTVRNCIAPSYSRYSDNVTRMFVNHYPSYPWMMFFVGLRMYECTITEITVFSIALRDVQYHKGYPSDQDDETARCPE